MPRAKRSHERFLDMGGPPVSLAKQLLGQRLVRVIDGTRVSGIIVEVEAYLGERDPAAHTFGGRRTPRNESMYLPGGHAYVYFTYGAHHCLNVVCGKKDEGVAVLIRALQPEEGREIMYANRPKARRDEDLCSGPGKLAEALAIDRRLDGVDLRTSGELFIELVRGRRLPTRHLGVSRRIGLNPTEHWGEHWPKRALRFYIIGNPHVSH